MAVYSLGVAGVVHNLLALGQCGLAIAIIVVVRQNLWWLLYQTFYPYQTFEVCLMGKQDIGVNLCSYTYWVVGLALFLSIALMFAQCFIRARKSYLLATLGLTLVGTIWWFGFAITATVYGVAANQQKPPVQEQSSREAVYIMGWVNVGLYTAALLLGGMTWGGCCKMGLTAEPQPGSYVQGMGPGGYQSGPGYVATGYPPQYQQPYPQQGYPQYTQQGYPYPPPNPFSAPPGAAPPAYPPPALPPPGQQSQFATNTI